MPQIKPVSDLRNYNEVLKDVAPGNPVYLTKNGHGRYVIYEIGDVERKLAEAKLMFELAHGEISVHDGGWISEEQIDEEFKNGSNL